MTRSSRSPMLLLRVGILTASTTLLAACFSSGPHPQPGVRFDGDEYAHRFMLGLNVPPDSRQAIGEIDGTIGGLEVADPTVLAADGVDPAQVVFVDVPGADGPRLDLFVSSAIDRGDQPWPAGICAYLTPGWVDPSTALPCAPPMIIEVDGRPYKDAGLPYEFAPNELTEIGPFTVPDERQADGLGTVAYQILDLPTDHAVAVAQGPGTYRVYVSNSVKGELDELCSKAAVPGESCAIETIPATPKT